MSICWIKFPAAMFLKKFCLLLQEHSWLEVSVQVMKGPSKNPLTQGRWDPIGPFLTKIEKIQPGVLTYPFSKFKNPPF